MCKSKNFARAAESVSRETEVPVCRILSDNKEAEVVDARSLLAVILFEDGYHVSQISAYLHRTAASVRYLIRNFEDRKATSKTIGNNQQNIRKHMENND